MRIRINVEIQEPSSLKTEQWRAVEATKLSKWSRGVCGPAVADLHHFGEELHLDPQSERSDPDPHHSEFKKEKTGFACPHVWKNAPENWMFSYQPLHKGIIPFIEVLWIRIHSNSIFSLGAA
jgi:hypothetical protein